MALRTWQELIRADYPELDTRQNIELDERRRQLDRFDRLEDPKIRRILSSD